MKHVWSILHAGALGDLALTLQLARRLPGVDDASGLAVASRAESGDLSRFWPPVARYSAETIGLHWLYADGDDSPPERLRGFVTNQRVLNALGDCDSIVHRRLSRLKPRALHSFDPRPGSDRGVHVVAQWKRQLEAGGLLLSECPRQARGVAAFEPPGEVAERGRSTFASRGVSDTPFLIHAGSGGREKCWPLSRFIELARLLRSHDLPTCFLLGPAELERWLSNDLNAVRTEFPTIENPPPDDLLALLAAARVLIGNDSGPAHLAALIGTRTVTIFGPTPATLWRPLGPWACVLVGDPQRDQSGWGLTPTRVLSAILDCE